MPAPDAALHRHNQWRLAVAQLLSGVGIASGIAVGAVLVEQLSGSTRLAGFAQTATILGAAVAAYPLAQLATSRGRRWALSLGFALGTVGAVLVLVGVQSGLTAVLFAGLTCFGGATAAGLQSRYAATDFAPPERTARAMSIVVWATTVGSVAGPQLTAPGARLGAMLGLDPLVGPYLFSLVSFALATLVVLGVRGSGTPRRDDQPRASMAACLALAWRLPLAFLGLSAVVLGHGMMVAVMVMTPLHMHHQDMALEVVGIVISGHILGMYGLSPVIGWLADRWGAVRVIMLGMALFAATFAAGIWDATSGSTLARLIPTLLLLGIAWSCTMIAGSALVAETIEGDQRLAFQGTVDTVMNLGAGLVTAATGTVLAMWGFVGINLMASAVLVLLALAALRARRP